MVGAAVLFPNRLPPSRFTGNNTGILLAFSVRSSANDDCSLDHDPLWLCPEIQFVRSAVEPNSAETCPVEAYRNGSPTSYLIVGAGAALNATHIEQRHIRDK